MPSQVHDSRETPSVGMLLNVLRGCREDPNVLSAVKKIDSDTPHLFEMDVGLSLLPSVR